MASDDNSSESIVNTFFTNRPECDPKSKDYVGLIKVDCSKAGSHAFACTAAGPVSTTKNSSCKQAQSIQLSDQISTLQSCKSDLFNKYASGSLSAARSGNGQFTFIFSNIRTLLDQELDLMDETLNTEIEVATYMSSVMVLLAIMVIVYFLFSKIIIY